MTANETRQAFGPLEARAEGSGLDRISLRDHIRSVEIGAFQSERGMTQRLAFNVVVEVCPSGPADDDVDLILSYDSITEAIDESLAEERLNLLETLAERVADRILAQPLAARVFVRVEKLDRGPGKLGVEIVRLPGDAGAGAKTGSATAPHVVFWDGEFGPGSQLSAWLDAWAGQPVVLCVEPVDGKLPSAVTQVARDQVALLSIGQNAWITAARDARLAVVATRTELDHITRIAGAAVWSPAKMVTDATPGTGPKEMDPIMLACWLAQELGSKPPVGIGAARPGIETWLDEQAPQPFGA